MLTYRTYELEQLNDGGVEEIVARPVGAESLDDRSQEVTLDDVPVVELILEANRAPDEPQRRWAHKHNGYQAKPQQLSSQTTIGWSSEDRPQEYSTKLYVIFIWAYYAHHNAQ